MCTRMKATFAVSRRRIIRERRWRGPNTRRVNRGDKGTAIAQTAGNHSPQEGRIISGGEARRVVIKGVITKN